MEEDETLSNPFYEAGIIKQRHYKKRKWAITIFHEHKCKKKKTWIQQNIKKLRQHSQVLQM